MIKKGKKDKQKDQKKQQEEVQIKMPNLIHPKEFYKLIKGTVHPEIDDKVKQLVNLVNQNIQNWQQNHQFTFELPQSQFDVTRQTPVINYVDQQRVVDDVQPHPLSESQRKSLYQTGTFIVNSKRYSIPYKWVVNRLLYLGKNQRRQYFLNILSYGFGELYKIKIKLFGNENQYSLAYVKRRFGQLFNDFVDAVIGRPYLTYTNKISPDELMQTQRQLNIKKMYWDNLNKSLNFLYSNDDYNQKNGKEKLDATLEMTQIGRIENQFNFQWSKAKQVIQQKLQQQFEDQQQIEQALIEQKYKMIMGIQTNLRQKLLEHLHFLLEQQRIISKAFRKMKQDNEKAKQEIIRQLKSHQIKSRYTLWYNDQLNARVSAVQKQNYYNTLQYLKNTLKTPFFSEYVEYCKSYQQKQTIAKQKVKVFRPLMQHYEQFLKAYSKAIYENGIYRLQEYSNESFNTGTYGWMLKYSLILLIGIFNTMIGAPSYGLRRGPFGLRYLFSKQQYNSRQSVDHRTGEKLYLSDPIKPLICQVKERIKQIKDKRAQFQQTPDTGFMKKSYARVFNLIYCYIFLGLIKLVLFNCILKPLFCGLCIVFFVAMITFSWYIAISSVIIEYLWSVFIYKYKIGDLGNYSKSQFPLPAILLKTIWNILRGIWTIIVALFFHPLFAIICLLFGILQFSISTVYYQFIFSIIKIIARSPTSDSKIAWRIEGPGISKNFSQKINADDIYILFLSQCQKIQLTRYQQIVTNKLNSIVAHNYSLVSPIISSFQLNPGIQNRVQQTINYYNKKLNDQIYQRMRIYPILHNSVVRFTQQQLNEYTGNCIEMVEFFMSSHKYADFYNFFNINKNDNDKADKLVVAIWSRIFGNRKVFEAYKSNLERYKVIENQRDDQQTQSMMKQINQQHHFKKRGYKKFKYETPSTATTTPVPTANVKFAPITNLVNQLRQINYQLISSKHNPQLSVLICPTIETLSLRLNDLKI